ncbi:MAG: DUF86 domain-containing protein [Spirochaetales bacterium]|nr:DUF86 domain-containing protein [Spirochaetales bacterium]
MDNNKDDVYYIERIIKDIDFVISHMKGKSFDDLSKDEVLVDSIMFRFIQIAENAHELSDSFLLKTEKLPWKQLRGIRNRIVHAYDVVRADIVYETVKNDLKPFRDELSKYR